MKRLVRVVPFLLLVLAIGCQESPMQVEESGPLSLAKKCPSTPCGKDPPPPPTDPTILYSAGTRKGGGPSRPGDYAVFLMDTNGNKTSILSDAVDPRWSPDGTRFVAHRERQDSDGRWTIEEILVANTDGSGVQVIASGNEPDWSTQDRILYKDTHGNGDLFVVNADGSDPSQLTSSGDVVNAIWSRDGNRVLATIQDGGYYRFRLYDVDCSTDCSVIPHPDFELSAIGLMQDDRVDALDWAHTRDEVVVGICIGGFGPCDIGILDLSNPVAPWITNITNSSNEGDYDAAWSWDDSQIAHANYTVGAKTAHIVIRDLETGDVTSLTPANPLGLDWRPTPPAEP